MYQSSIFKGLLKSFWITALRLHHKNVCDFSKAVSKYQDNNALTLEDFTWIYIDKKKKIGYYSYKTGNYEICIDERYPCWVVSLSNKYEEVLEEIEVPDKDEAVIEARRYYDHFNYKLK